MKKDIVTSSQEAKNHHGNNPGDRDGFGLFPIPDPERKEDKACVEINQANDTPRHGDKLAAFLAKVTDHKSPDDA